MRKLCSVRPAVGLLAWVAAAFAFGPLPALAAPPPAPLPALTNVGTGTAGKYPLGVAINPNTARALVANRDSRTASLIDLMTGAEVWETTVGRGPVGAAVNPATNVGVVTLADEKAVALLNLNTAAVIRKLKVSGRPQGVAVDPEFNVAIVAVQPDAVAIIDLATMTVVTQLLVGRRPVGVAVNPLTRIAAVTNERDGTIVLVDYGFPALPTVANTIALPRSRDPKDPTAGPRAKPRGVAFDHGPSTNRLAVADPGSGLLVIVTLDASNHAVDFAAIDPTPGKSDKPVAVAVNPGFDYGIVTTGGDNGTGSTVYAFTLTQPGLLGMVPRSKGEPRKPGGVAIDPVTCRAVVTAQDLSGVKANLLLLATPCAPVITQLIPPAAQAGSTFVLRVSGTGFNATQTTLNFGAVGGIPMTQVAPGVMSATVTAPGTVGPINVSVTSNGKTSNVLPFNVTLLQPPVLCAVTPTTSVADQNALPLQIRASGVTAGATVSFGGQPIVLNSITSVPPTTDAAGCVTKQIVAATVPAYPDSTLTTHATLPSPQVHVKNSDGVVSNSLTVVITNPVPVLSSLVPASAAVGSSDVTILIFGNDFVYDVVDGAIVMLSLVRFDGVPLAQVIPYGPSPRTQVQVVVPSALMQAVKTYVVDVFNPGPGGGASVVTQPFEVTGNELPAGMSVTTVPIVPENATPTAVTLLKDATTLTGVAGVSDAADLRFIDMTTPGSPALLASPVVPVGTPGELGNLRALPGPGKAVVTTLVNSDQVVVIDYSAAGAPAVPYDLNVLAGTPCGAPPCHAPVAVAVDTTASPGKVVVLNFSTATLQVLNVTDSGSGPVLTSAGALIPIPVVSPVGLALDTSTGTAVVLDSPDPDPGVLLRVGYRWPNYGVVGTPIPIGNLPAGIDIDVDLGTNRREAVVSLSGDNTIQVIDLTANDACAATPGCAVRATLTAGSNPSGVAVDPVSHRAIVTNINNTEVTGINLTPAVPSVTRFQLTFAAQNPTDIAWDPASGQAIAATLLGQANYAIIIGGLTPDRIP